MAGEGSSGEAGETPRAPLFRETPLALRAWVSATVVAAVVVPLVLDDRVDASRTGGQPVTALAIIVASVLNVEIGRILEGGPAHSQRPHKALSTWSLVTAVLLPITWLLPIVAVCYAHARWRGMRVQLWKWVGSAGYVVLAGVAAAAVADGILGGDASLTNGSGLCGMLAVLGATAALLAVETALFHGSAYLNTHDDEVWLRQTLRQPAFYLTEVGMLLMGGLAAAVWVAAPWFLTLLIPMFVLAQQAALHEPLRQRADHDDKTGLLRFGSWDRLARTALARCERHAQPWSVLFADLDHFKAFNDRWGHLAGDVALETAATVLRAQLREDDLVARFGGEEFCVFLPRTGLEEGLVLAERIRGAIARADLLPDDQTLTVSLGIASVPPGQSFLDLTEVVRSADAALYEAKQAGRDTVRGRVVAERTAPRPETVTARAEGQK